MPEKNKPLLEVREITKKFGGLTALENVSFKIHRNEIFGLVGDNGAGKLTLVKVIAGVLKPTSGRIYFKGEELINNSIKKSRELGIEVLYQTSSIVGNLNVIENIFLGREMKKTGILGRLFNVSDFKKMRSETQQIIDKFQINMSNYFQKLSRMSGGQRQSVALGKAAYWGSKLIILDEPTTALGVRESENALKLIKKLKSENTSVIIISHNLEHIFKIVDRIMVIRRGKKIGIKNRSETSAHEIVSMITGAETVTA
jgi:ABC-type sugar transport system ATPase subunit